MPRYIALEDETQAYTIVAVFAPAAQEALGRHHNIVARAAAATNNARGILYRKPAGQSEVDCPGIRQSENAAAGFHRGKGGVFASERSPLWGKTGSYTCCHELP